MKIQELLNEEEQSQEEKIYNFVTQHKDEVFGYWDATLQKEFAVEDKDKDKDKIDYYLWKLEQNKRISKTKIGRKVYYGSHEAIEELEKKRATKNKPKE